MHTYRATRKKRFHLGWEWGRWENIMPRLNSLQQFSPSIIFSDFQYHQKHYWRVVYHVKFDRCPQYVAMATPTEYEYDLYMITDDMDFLSYDHAHHPDPTSPNTHPESLTQNHPTWTIRNRSCDHSGTKLCQGFVWHFPGELNTHGL